MANELTYLGLRNRIIQLIDERIGYFAPGLGIQYDSTGHLTYNSSYALLSLGDTNGDGTVDATDVWASWGTQITEVTLSASSVSVVAGRTATINIVSKTPTDPQNSTIIPHSSNEDIATVSISKDYSTISVTGITAGNSETCNITLTNPQGDTIKLLVGDVEISDSAIPVTVTPVQQEGDQ